MSENTPGVDRDSGYGVVNSSNNASKNEKKKENSPEHAGVVRGLARSAAQRGASHVAVGRLPLPAHGHGALSSVASKAHVQKAISSAKVARIQNVAKISEHANKGVEVFEAHHHAEHQHKASAEAKIAENNSNTNGSTSTTKKVSNWMNRASTFAGALVKNTILGLVVFHAYEGVIGRIAGHSEESQHHSSEHGEATLDEIKSSALWKHYVAGFCAGGTHASLGSLIDGVAALRITAPPTVNAMSPMKWFQTTGRSFYPKLMQNSVSHAVLFGSYVTVKRTVALATTTTGPRKETNSTHLEHEINRSDFFDGGLVSVVFAGGIAGIAQQFAADMTRQVTNAVRNNTRSANESLLSAIKPTSYTPRSLIMVSLPTAIGFVAFEYGRQEAALEEEE